MEALHTAFTVHHDRPGKLSDSTLNEPYGECVDPLAVAQRLTHSHCRDAVSVHTTIVWIYYICHYCNASDRTCSLGRLTFLSFRGDWRLAWFCVFLCKMLKKAKNEHERWFIWCQNHLGCTHTCSKSLGPNRTMKRRLKSMQTKAHNSHNTSRTTGDKIACICYLSD